MKRFKVYPFEHSHLSNTIIDEVELNDEPTAEEILDTLESEDHALIDGEYIERSDLRVVEDDMGYIVRYKKPNAYGESAVWLLRREE